LKLGKGDGDNYQGSSWGYVFYECKNLETVEFPNKSGNIYLLAPDCFTNCVKLKTNILKYTTNLGYLPPGTFSGCHELSNIIIHNGASWFPFSPTKWQSVGWISILWSLSFIVFGGLTAIINYTIPIFRNCHQLKNIYIEGDAYSVTEFGFSRDTFRSCMAVENIYCNSYRPPYIGAGNIWKNGAINPKTCKLYIPTGCKLAYKSKAQWGDFPNENIIEYTPEQFEAVKQRLQEEQ
jgi:hypothetical protein